MAKVAHRYAVGSMKRAAQMTRRRADTPRDLGQRQVGGEIREQKLDRTPHECATDALLLPGVANTEHRSRESEKILFDGQSIRSVASNAREELSLLENRFCGHSKLRDGEICTGTQGACIEENLRQCVIFEC